MIKVKIPYARVRLGTCERIHRLGCSVVADGDRKEVVITPEKGEPKRGARMARGKLPLNRG